MKYLTSLEVANRIGKTKRWVNDCCAKGLIQGAYKDGIRWMIPENAKWEVGSEKTIAPLPIGISNFETAVSDYYYVDKTLLIKDIIDFKPQVSLFLRPRRFGKTLNMDMLKTFFERSSISRADLFYGTDIWKVGSRYKSEQGKYPVIFLTFKDIKYDNWDDTLINLKNAIRQEYKRHAELLSGDKLSEVDISFFKNVIDDSLENALWPTTLGRLSEMLHIEYAIPAMIFIDEYDTPIQQGHTSGFYNEVIGFMRNFLSGGLKDNIHLAYAFLTGILRVAKESIFSGLNNLNTNSVLEKRYSQYFGFTEAEVKKLLRDYGFGKHFDEVREWYDGYRFGNTEIYNPWSVLNYVDSECEAKAYWQSTGSNEIIGELVAKGGQSIAIEMRALLSGERKRTYVDTAVIYPEVTRNVSSVYSFLLMSGYLTVDEIVPMEDGNSMCVLKIPNKEIMIVYEKEILSRKESLITQEDSIEFKTALMNADTGKLKQLLQDFLKESISFHDASAEGFYHGLMLGLSAMLYNYFDIKSNREAGEGRYDICLKSRDDNVPHFVIEVKSLKEAISADKVQEALSKEAIAALGQIEEKDYVAELKGEVMEIGVAFWKKKCEVKTKTIRK